MSEKSTIKTSNDCRQGKREKMIAGREKEKK